MPNRPLPKKKDFDWDKGEPVKETEQMKEPEIIENLPATKQQHLPAVKDYDNMDEFGLTEDDIIWPVISLAQPTSEGEKEAGSFYIKNQKTGFSTFEAVFLKIVPTRIMFNQLKQGISCGSANRVVPYSFLEEVMAERCVECRFSKRGYKEDVVDERGNKIPNKFWECNESYSVMGVMKDTMIPFVFRTKRTANFPLTSLVSMLKMDYLSKGTPLYNNLIQISSLVQNKVINGTKTKYYIPQFECIGQYENVEIKNMFTKAQKVNVEEVAKETDDVEEHE